MVLVRFEAIWHHRKDVFFPPLTDCIITHLLCIVIYLNHEQHLNLPSTPLACCGYCAHSGVCQRTRYFVCTQQFLAERLNQVRWLLSWASYPRSSESSTKNSAGRKRFTTLDGTKPFGRIFKLSLCLVSIGYRFSGLSCIVNLAGSHSCVGQQEYI